MTKAYLLGALHDGTVRKLTFRIVQKDRQLYVVEFSKSFLKDFILTSQQDKIDYIRGYFDAEGGISRNSKVRYYIYFAQKNLKDLLQLKEYLTEIGIKCGSLHNPSKKVDPNYWRFFISIKSYELFAQLIGSWHPVKSHFLRMKI